MKLPFLKLTLAALSIAPHLPAQAAPAAPAAKPQMAPSGWRRPP